MTTKNLLNFGKLCALLFFLFGTMLLGLYYQTSSAKWITVTFYYILSAAIVTLVLLIFTLSIAYSDKENRKKAVSTTLLLLFNVPVLVLYIWFVLKLKNTMRIAFTNVTQSPLTDINVVGCETDFIEKLEIGESKIVWIAIKGDCDIQIEYLVKGKRKKERVVEYATSGMGEKIKYEIGTVKERQ